MTKISHFEIYKVRYCECDAFGFLRSSNYLRWMQETAFAASGAVGYDFAKYDEIGRLWLVRETEIEYIFPIRAGDGIELTTWVIDFRRFRSRRAYELRLAETGQLAARAVTDWVYLDSQSLRPALIPEEMRMAFLPEGAGGTEAGRKRFPKAAVPESGFLSHHVRVEWSDIDTMWHVNNADYLRYIENADAQVECENGLATQQLAGTVRGVETKRHHIEYRQPAILGDELEIVTWCSDRKDDSFHQHYEIRRVGDGELLTQAWALRVFSDVADGEREK